MTQKNKNFLIQYKKQQLTGIKKKKKNQRGLPGRRESPKSPRQALVHIYGALGLCVATMVYLGQALHPTLGAAFQSPDCGKLSVIGEW